MKKRWTSSGSTHVVLEEENPTEEAEEVSGEQREADGGGAAQLHHDGHEAVESVEAQGEAGEQEACRGRSSGLGTNQKSEKR